MQYPNVWSRRDIQTKQNKNGSSMNKLLISSSQCQHNSQNSLTERSKSGEASRKSKKARSVQPPKAHDAYRMPSPEPICHESRLLLSSWEEREWTPRQCMGLYAYMHIRQAVLYAVWGEFLAYMRFGLYAVWEENRVGYMRFSEGYMRVSDGYIRWYLKEYGKRFS